MKRDIVYVYVLYSNLALPLISSFPLVYKVLLDTFKHKGMTNTGPVCINLYQNGLFVFTIFFPGSVDQNILGHYLLSM